MSTEIVKHGRAEATKGRVAKAAVKSAGNERPGQVRAVSSTVVARVVINDPPTGRPKPGEIPDGLAKKYFLKSTFNTSDIMHSPVEKTLRMLDKILSGERLFTM